MSVMVDGITLFGDEAEEYFCGVIDQLQTQLAAAEERNRSLIDTIRKSVGHIEKGILYDTNGQFCLYCEGENWDYEGVIHKQGCPFEDLPEPPTEAK